MLMIVDDLSASNPGQNKQELFVDNYHGQTIPHNDFSIRDINLAVPRKGTERFGM